MTSGVARRLPHLIAHWDGGASVVTNYRTGTRVPLSPGLLRILDFLGEWRSLRQIAAELGTSPRMTSRVVASLCECGLAEASRTATGDLSADPWPPWDPAAGHFHFSTRDTRFNADLLEGERALLEKARTQPALSATKVTPPGARSLALGDATESPLTKVLMARRTWRSFARSPVPKASLSTLLKFTFGAQHWATSPTQGRVAFKTSPSGGACHPIEAYVAAVRVEGVAPGLYHYDFEHHRLRLVRRGASSSDLRQWIQAQPWFWKAPMVVFLTAVFHRTGWRYPSPRAYRNILLEAGHLCQTFCLMATDLGLAPFCTHALRDSLVDKALGLDGASEGVVYAAGCGVRPATGWSPDVPGVSKELL